MAEETAVKDESLPDAPPMHDLIYAPVETHSQFRTKVTHNIIAVLGQSADEVKGSLMALGCMGPEPITQLLMKLGFKTVTCYGDRIELDDIMTGDRFWFQVPGTISDFWEKFKPTGEPQKDDEQPT